MRISGIFNNNFSISCMGINTKSKTSNVKKHAAKNFQPVQQTGEGDVFIKKDRVSRLYHKNGNVSSETVYKNDKPYTETWYDFNGKAQWIKYLDGSFDLSRNDWHDWKKAPRMELEKTEGDKTIRIEARPAVLAKGDLKGEVGGFHLSIADKSGDTVRADLYQEPDGTFEDYNEQNLPELKTALMDLLGVISSAEYKDDFGGSRNFNNGVKAAIKYIDSKEQSV